MSYKEHAKREFIAAGWIKEDGSFCDEMQKMMCDQVIELIDLFSKQGHSGFSAPYAINLFEKLAKFEPIVPLTGKDDEWNDSRFSEELTKQNKRCSHVFKDSDGRAFDINGKIFRTKSGSCYTNRESRVYIDFPYTPKREYVDVEED